MPLTRIQTTRRLALGAVAAVAALAPATAAAYAPGSPGEIGNAVSYMMSEDTWLGNESTHHFDKSQNVKTETTGLAEAGSPGWPLLPNPWPGDRACLGGCASADSVTYGRSDTAAGIIETYARGVASVTGSGRSAAAGGFVRSHLDDTITVSQNTVVTLRGRVQAVVDRFSTDPDNLSHPSGKFEVDLRFGHCGAEGCGTDGFFGDYQPDVRNIGGGGTLNVDETFEVEVPLEAGETPFNAELMSTAFGNTIGADGTRTVGGRADAARSNGDPHKVEFEIVVPDDVFVSSGSGKLPIVGGKTQEPSDTTPPTLQVPGKMIVNATSPSGAIVAYSVQATDETTPDPTVDCSPASGSKFAIGTTTVTCTATDAAGNATTKAFTVHVRSAAEMQDNLMDLIAGLHPKAQKQLSPHAKKLTCQGMRQVIHHADILAKQGYLPNPEPVKSAAAQIAAALGC